METLARELRGALASGVFARRGRVALSDGVTVEAERMARIVLTDLDRVDRDGTDPWLTDAQLLLLHDDLVRLVTVAATAVPA